MITASGGPFRGRSRAELEDVTVEDALQHPTWAMGGKITIDSATLMNKGLEVIEAHHLFGTPYDRIDVVVHPQSIVHALVQLCDGATLAHLGHPDMRVPIAYALHHPERVDVPVPALDLAEVGLADLRAAGPRRVPLPAPGPRGRRVAGGTAPCVLNAANEVAVHAFLGGPARLHRHPGGDRGHARAGRRRPRALASSRSTTADAEARRDRRRARRRGGARVSWFLAFVGFAVLIILHELGPLRRRQGGRDARRALLAVLPAADLRRQRRGETEYAIGAIPLGGYVKITGMNPHGGDPAGGRPPRLLPPAGVEADRRDRARARRSTSCWRSLILTGARAGRNGDARPTAQPSTSVQTSQPASRGVLQAGRPDRRRRRPHAAAPTTLRDADRHAPLRGQADARLQGRRRPRRSSSSATARRSTVTVQPVYDAEAKRMRCSASLQTAPRQRRRARPAPRELSVDEMWCFTSRHRQRRSRRSSSSAEKRKQVSGVVGSYEVTRQTIEVGLDTALLPARRDLAVARRHQPVPVPAARRRAHLLGAGREGARPRDPVQRDGAGRLRRASRS